MTGGAQGRPFGRAQRRPNALHGDARRADTLTETSQLGYGWTRHARAPIVNSCVFIHTIKKGVAMTISSVARRDRLRAVGILTILATVASTGLATAGPVVREAAGANAAAIQAAVDLFRADLGGRKQRQHRRESVDRPPRD